MSVVHSCPTQGDGLTPCCNVSPFELPRRDRMSLDEQLVTCDVNARKLAEAGSRPQKARLDEVQRFGSRFTR